MKVAVWIAGALSLGWLITAGVAVLFPGGHPPLSFYVGGVVVLLSLLLAPIGTGTALASVRRARRDTTRTPRGAMVVVVLNALFLLVAVLPLLVAVLQVLWSWW